MPKANQIKQIWLNPQDDENVERLAKHLQEIGVDVEPDNRRAKEPFSHTKVIRWALAKLASELDS